MDNLKEDLAEYIEVYERPTPIKYDILRLSDEHRKFDGLIRRYWDDFHPLVRDLFTSFANEFQYLIELTEQVEKKKDEESSHLKSEMVSQLENVNQMLDKLRLEYDTLLEEKEEELNEQINETQKSGMNFEQLDKSYQSTLAQNQIHEKLVVQQKNEIERLQEEISDESGKVNSEIIHQSIANVDAFTKQLEILEQEMLVLESQKEQAETKAALLEEKLNSQDKQFQKQVSKRKENLDKMKQNVKELFKRAQKNVDELKDYKEKNSEIEEKIANQERLNSHLEKENFRIKELLENQIGINRNYHNLTLKVIEISKSSPKVGSSPKFSIPSPSDSLPKINQSDINALVSSADDEAERIGHTSEKENRPPEKELKDPELDDQVETMMSSLLKKIDDSEKGIRNIMEDFPRPPKKEKSKSKKAGKDRPLSS